MKGLRDKDKLILQAISDAMPQGIIPSILSAQVNLSHQNLNRYLKKLVLRSLIRKRKMGVQTYYFTINASAVGSSEPFTPKQIQRPHAILTSIQLFRSHWELIKPSLEAKGIPFKLGMRGRCMDADWQGRNVKCYINGLIMFKPQIEALPLNVPLDAIEEKAAAETGVLAEAFLAQTGLRAFRSRPDNKLIVSLRYFENGYPSNQIAEESLKDKDRIVYVYDTITGKAVVWADSSLATMKELETNNKRVDEQMKAWLGATKTGEISPYNDEIRTRQELAEIREIQLTQAHDLAKYAHNEIVHLDLLNRIRAEELKIKDMLSQRRLF